MHQDVTDDELHAGAATVMAGIAFLVALAFGIGLAMGWLIWGLA